MITSSRINWFKSSFSLALLIVWLKLSRFRRACRAFLEFTLYLLVEIGLCLSGRFIASSIKPRLRLCITHMFYKKLPKKFNSQIAKNLRNSSTWKILFKKLFILVKELLGIFLLYFRLLPVSYYSKSTWVRSNIGKASKNLVLKCSRGLRL